MKTKEQIKKIALTHSDKFGNEAVLNETVSSLIKWTAEESFLKGYEQAQKDAMEREAKLIECVKFYSNNGGSSWDDLGGKRAREVLKELGIE